MLEPDLRHLYTEVLAPPAGFQLEKAVGTTFSLDLVTLLLTPMAFAERSLDEAEELMQAASEDSTRDGDAQRSAHQTPLPVIEALRRAAKKMVLFCQRGRISIPRTHSLLFGYLEDMIREVQLPQGVFHPKVWILHYSAEDDDIYRVVCTSRNVTFDRSWDVVVSVDGRRVDTENVLHPELVEFVSHLAQHDDTYSEPSRQTLLRDLASELRQVRFHPPEGFDSVDFHFQGFGNAPLVEAMPDFDSLLLISPFLAKGGVSALRKRRSSSGDLHLISRQESLDELCVEAPGALEGWGTWTLSHDEALELESNDNELVGLHAKSYLAESDELATWWLGSANCTAAGLMGHNVEFMTELSAPTRRLSVSDLLSRSEQGDRVRLGDMLLEYIPSDLAPEEVGDTAAEKAVDALRGYLSAGSLRIDIGDAVDGANTYPVTLRFDPPENWSGPIPEGSGHVWQLTVDEGVDRRSWDELGRTKEVDFGELSLLSLTRFVAFELRCRVEGMSSKSRFVMAAEVFGMPEERDTNLLQHLIQNQERFIQYLRFLLSDEPDYWDVSDLDAEANAPLNSLGSKSRGYGRIELPLLEEIVAKCVQHPARVREIHSLIESVRRLPDADELIPADFLTKVWLPVLTALEPELAEDYDA